MDSLWTETLRHLSEGNYTSLQDHLGGPEGFHRHVVEWHSDGSFEGHDDLLAEALTCACMLGRTETAEYLLNVGVEPYAGMKTGLAGSHYSASGGRVAILKLLIGHGIDLEIENSYGGTVLGQALWSAVCEPKDEHPEIIDLLISTGAKTQKGTLDWWLSQEIPELRKREIASILEHHRVE